jgi:hypothetical protein
MNGWTKNSIDVPTDKWIDVWNGQRDRQIDISKILSNSFNMHHYINLLVIVR